MSPEDGSTPTGVLVMAHGTPADEAGIAPFYTSIRRGRPPTPELLAELVGRYRAIGGTSPLAQRTAAQVEGIRNALDAVEPGRFRVGFGAKHTDPSIETGAAALLTAGVDPVVGVVLAPHGSAVGSGQYLERAAAALDGPGAPRFVPVPSWHRAPGLADLLAARLIDVLARVGRDVPVGVFFTAHSVPERTIAGDHPVTEQVAESATDVAEAAGLDGLSGVRWGVAWQSAGRTGDVWVGPDLLAEIDRMADAGAGAVVVVPVGFVADHLEVLYDLDVEARAVAEARGMTFARTPSLNADPSFCAVVARVVRHAVADAGGTR